MTFVIHVHISISSHQVSLLQQHPQQALALPDGEAGAGSETVVDVGPKADGSGVEINVNATPFLPDFSWCSNCKIFPFLTA